jgi:hypothetical protein
MKITNFFIFIFFSALSLYGKQVERSSGDKIVNIVVFIFIVLSVVVYLKRDWISSTFGSLFNKRKR